MGIDPRTRNALAVIAVFVAVMMIGQAMIYVASPYHCDMTAERDGSSVDVTVDTNYSLGYTINSLRTDSMRDVTSYAVYCDDSYPVKGDRAVILDAIKRLRLCFSNDNCTLSTIDATGLQDLMSHRDTTTAVLFMTGTLPEEIYDGRASSPIFEWLADGGVMYWLHEKLGATYVERNGRIVDVEDPDGLFFGNSDVINPSGGQVFTKNLVDGSLTDKLGIYYGETTNGVDCSLLASPYLALDYNDGTYSAVTLVRYIGGDGVIGVFGGNLKYEAVPTSAMASVAQTIVSKLSYDTILVDHTTASGSGTVTLDCGGGFSYVFMFVDRVNAVWAKALPLA